MVVAETMEGIEATVNNDLAVATVVYGDWFHRCKNLRPDQVVPYPSLATKDCW